MQQEGRPLTVTTGFDIVDTVVSVDGMRRDTVAYPLRSQFVIPLPAAMRNISVVELLNASIPAVPGVTDVVPYFLLSVEDLDFYQAGVRPSRVFAVLHPGGTVNGFMSLDKKAAERSPVIFPTPQSLSRLFVTLMDPMGVPLALGSDASVPTLANQMSLLFKVSSKRASQVAGAFVVY